MREQSLKRQHCHRSFLYNLVGNCNECAIYVQFKLTGLNRFLDISVQFRILLLRRNQCRQILIRILPHLEELFVQKLDRDFLVNFVSCRRFTSPIPPMPISESILKWEIAASFSSFICFLFLKHRAPLPHHKRFYRQQLLTRFV